MQTLDRQQQRQFTAGADETLEEAADRMRWHAIGALPVFDRHGLVGIITRRNLTAAIADGADPARTPVSRYMTRAPAAAGSDGELVEVRRAMSELGIRHLPIVEGGRSVGVLSIYDLPAAEASAASRN